MVGSLLNQQIGRYQIKALIGRGGMAAVYRAYDTRLQRDVALKVLYPQYGDDPLLVERFKREAITAASLEHPAIVPVYDIGEHDGFVFIAMKLLHGRSLADLLREQGTLHLRDLLDLLAPVAAALDYAHARGIVHRDIKPANILLSGAAGNGQLEDAPATMLSDFGIAKVLNAPGMTTTGALIGTPEYMAPEQIGNRRVDGRSDVYALGVLVYRALVGRQPFEGSTQDVLMAHLHGRVPPPSSLNPQLDAAIDYVLLRAMAPDPDARYPTAGAFIADLAGVTRAGTVAGISPLLRQPSAAINQQPTFQQPLPTPNAVPVPQESAVMLPTRRTSASGGRAGVRTTASQRPRRGLLAPIIALVALLAVAALGLALLSLLRGSIALPPTPVPIAAVDTPDAGAGAAASATATATASSTATPTATSAEAVAPTISPEPDFTPEPPVVTALVTSVVTATPRPATPLPPPTAAPPTATAVPPTATTPPSPTPTATPCPIAASRGFGKIYAENPSVRERLGCATTAEQAGVATQQFFQSGTMYYWQATETIYVLLGLQEGPVRVFSQPEVAALPEPDPPPTDPNAPPGGFGRIYYNREQIRAQIGEPLSPMELLQPHGAFQRFQGGLMLFTPDYRGAGKNIFVVYNDGSFERYVDTFQD